MIDIATKLLEESCFEFTSDENQITSDSEFNRFWIKDHPKKYTFYETLDCKECTFLKSNKNFRDHYTITKVQYSMKYIVPWGAVLRRYIIRPITQNLLEQYEIIFDMDRQQVPLMDFISTNGEDFLVTATNTYDIFIINLSKKKFKHYVFWDKINNGSNIYNARYHKAVFAPYEFYIDSNQQLNITGLYKGWIISLFIEGIKDWNDLTQNTKLKIRVEDKWSSDADEYRDEE